MGGKLPTSADVCRSSEPSNGQIASEAQVPLISSGLGKIGVTRSGGMRRRLFAIQQALAEALRTLAPGGVLVISCLASGLLWEVSAVRVYASQVQDILPLGMALKSM